MVNEKYVNIPLSREQVKESINNNNLKYIVNYKDSEFKNEKLFSYLNNLKLSYEIHFDDSLPYDDFESLLKTYLSTDIPITSVVLSLFSGYIILKYLKSEEMPFEINVSEKYIIEFIEKNQELLDKVVLFLDSLPVFIERSNGINKHYPIIDDVNYIGLNIVSLLLNRHFTMFYSSLERDNTNKCYFICHDTLPVFFGNTIHLYLNEEHNYLARLPTLAITGHKY